MVKLDRILNLAELETAARRALPRPLFDSIAAGAGDELTTSSNQDAFREIRLMPRVLGDVARSDMRTEILGTTVSSPVMLDPTGYQRMAHPDAELAVARAAGRAGVLFALSSVTSYALEDVAAAATGPRWFQLYQPRGDAAAADALIDRAAAAGFDALCVTVDTTVRAFRERDARNRFTMPLRIGPRLIAQGARHPRWAVGFLRGTLSGRDHHAGPAVLSIVEAQRLMDSAMKPITWTDLARIRRRWAGPLVVKGLLRADQVDAVLDAGVDGIVVSNHGGRLLDTGPATIEALPAVAEAVDGRAQVFLDGGIRRGTDVVKALALGATGCLIGRPFLHGLAVAGEQGVLRALEILNSEVERAMGFLGAATVADVDRSCVRMPDERWGRSTAVAPPRSSSRR